MRKCLWLTLAAAISACGGAAVSANPGNGDGGTTGDDGGTTGDDSSTSKTTPLARGLAVSVAVFQATKALIVDKGTKVATPKAPVVAGRPGLVRVYVTPDSSWSAHDVTCELHMNANGMDLPVQTKTMTVSGPSDDATAGSTFDFAFTADQMPEGTTFSVAIRDATAKPQPDDDTGAWFPNDGTNADFAAMGALELEVIMVPLKYNADGSGRVPDTSAAQMKLFNDTLYKMYPVSKVNMTLHAPVPWADQIAPNGQGWDTVLQGLIDLRQQESPPVNSFYVAFFEPAASIQDFCAQGGCVLGIAPGGVGPGDVFDRIATTLGYTGSNGPDTLTQELAHAMGRLHAPCGNPQAVDSAFPDKQGRIGVWGYNILTQKFINPTSRTYDFMSYCSPIWTSDYTYNAIAKRLNFVNKTAGQHKQAPASPEGAAKYQWVSVKADGSLVPGKIMSLNTHPQGTAHAMTFHAADGRVVASDTAHFYPYGGQPGGFMFVPVAPAGATQMRVDGLGTARVSALH